MNTPFPLGRHPEAAANHDPRSLDYPAFTAPALTDRRWRRYGAVLDQGQTSSCTGNAGVGALNHAPLHVVGTTYHEPDALSVYGAATEIDPYPGAYPAEDTGSDGLSVAKVLLNRGLIVRYNHAFGLDHVLAAAQVGPLMVGTVWREDMFYPDSSGLVRPTGADVGGHEYVLDGTLVGPRLVRFTNSWSSSWGVSGRFYMTWDDFGALLDAGGDAVQLVRV